MFEFCGAFSSEAGVALRILCFAPMNGGNRSCVGSVLVVASWLGDGGGEVIAVSVGRSRFIWIRRLANEKKKRSGRPGRARSSARAVRTRVLGLGARVTGGV